MRLHHAAALATALNIATMGSVALAADAAPPAALVVVDAGAVATPVALDAAVAAPTAEAPPKDAVEEAKDVPGTLAKIMASVRSGNWRSVAALALALLMLALSALKIRKRIPFFAGDRGGAILVFVLGLGGALATALQTDAALDLTLFLGALSVTYTAVGGYTWFKRLIWPSDAPATPAAE